MPSPLPRYLRLVPLALLVVGVGVAWWVGREPAKPTRPRSLLGDSPAPARAFVYQPRLLVETNAYAMVTTEVAGWSPDAPLAQIAELWRRPGHRILPQVEALLARPDRTPEQRLHHFTAKAGLLNYEGEAARAYEVLAEARKLAESDTRLAGEWLYTFVFLQGLTALRRGENENCIDCRGDGACILPLAASAVHTNPTGSRLAVRHFTEYLDQFPDDLEVRWLLNVAHMTLGEYPGKVDPRFRLSLARYEDPTHSIGKFRDVGVLVGINRLNQAGGAILDDFDGDDRLDLVFTSMDPARQMVFHRNTGDGKFEDRTREAGLLEQYGGLNCVQGDYDDDGFPDVFIPRGAWLKTPMRPSLLHNNGNGTFTDVTAEAGVGRPGNSICGRWVDYDNDGRLDLFACGETGPNLLYRNLGGGKFEDVAGKVGLAGAGGVWKGAAWADFDGDGRTDVFLTDIAGTARLFRNTPDGTFCDVTAGAGIDGPRQGFSCWAWDYDNDGWPDIFATSFDRSLGDVVKGLTDIGPHDRHPSKLYKNLGGKGFRDVTAEAGLDFCFSAMGGNFADFDNDGLLDFYLGTGDPDIAMLVPNRMFRNLGGGRFAEITGSSGTGHLQKGHGVACGDWDRNGTVDLAVQMGGATPGDQYHNVLFQNPGQGNHWLNVKLVGTKSNRSAVGARIKVVTAGDSPRTVYRHVSPGGSFGANPLEQMIGLGKAERVAVLEVAWPAGGPAQTFRDLAADQAIEITESSAEFKKREYRPIPLPK